MSLVRNLTSLEFDALQSDVILPTFFGRNICLCIQDTLEIESANFSETSVRSTRQHDVRLQNILTLMLSVAYLKF